MKNHPLTDEICEAEEKSVKTGQVVAVSDR